MFGKSKNNNVMEQGEKMKKPFYKRWWFIALVVIVIIGALGGGEDEPKDVAKEPIEQAAATAGNESKREFTASEKELLKKNYADFTEEEKEEYEALQYNYSKYNDEYSDETKAEWRDQFVRLQTEALEESIESVKVVEEKVTETLSQKNAVKMAENYLDYTSFSKSGLIGQLEYEGFSNEDATYAVNQMNVDWKEQAVAMAKSYLDYTSFSKSGLIEQLEYEGFSNEDATYAAEQAGF